jgi:hypothetical protein
MESPQMTDEEERNRESYLRLQRLAVDQLGYTINLLLTFSVGVLAFAVKLMMDSKSPFPASAHWMLHGSSVLMLMCIASGIGANLTRTLDYRYTRRAVRARWKCEPVEQDKYHDKADTCGKWTWRFFPTQAATFVLGVTFLSLSLWIAFGQRV